MVSHGIRGTVAPLSLDSGRSDTGAALFAGHMSNKCLKSYKNRVKYNNGLSWGLHMIVEVNRTMMDPVSVLRIQEVSKLGRRAALRQERQGQILFRL